MPEEEQSAGMKSDEMITDFPLISFNDVTFGYGDEKVLINVSFDVKKRRKNSFCRRKWKWEKHNHKTDFKTNIKQKWWNIL